MAAKKNEDVSDMIDDDDMKETLKGNKMLSTDAMLLKIWCLTNGWDAAAVIDKLEAIDITGLSHLKKAVREDIIDIDFSDCGLSTNKTFAEKFDEMMAMKKIKVEYPGGRNRKYAKRGGGGLKMKESKSALKMKKKKKSKRRAPADKTIGFSVGGAKVCANLQNYENV